MPERSGQLTSHKLLVAVEDETAFVRIEGRGSFKNSPSLKSFGKAAIARDHVHRFIFDFKHCVGMDSTFMGVMAGLSVQLKKECGGIIYAVNLSPRTRGLLATLGLDQLVKTYMEGNVPSEIGHLLGDDGNMNELEQPKDALSSKETTETILEAHETLVEVFPENLPKFEDVLMYLKEELNEEPNR